MKKIRFVKVKDEKGDIKFLFTQDDTVTEKTPYKDIKDTERALWGLTNLFYTYAERLTPEQKKSVLAQQTPAEMVAAIDNFIAGTQDSSNSLYKVSLNDAGELSLAAGDTQTVSPLAKFLNLMKKYKIKKNEYNAENDDKLLNEFLNQTPQMTRGEAMELIWSFFEADDKEAFIQGEKLKNKLKNVASVMTFALENPEDIRFLQDEKSRNSFIKEKQAGLRVADGSNNPPKTRSWSIVKKVCIGHESETDEKQHFLYEKRRYTYTSKEYSPIRASIAVLADGTTEMFVHLPKYGAVSCSNFESITGKSFADFSKEESLRWKKGVYNSNSKSVDSVKILGYELTSYKKQDEKKWENTSANFTPTGELISSPWGGN